MLRTLTITGFRCFSSLRVESLQRVNLLVGRNNAGKTCLLEAIETIATQGPASWQAAAVRRGELISTEVAPGSFQNQIDARHAFHGRSLEPGTSFQIDAEDDSGPLQVKAEIREAPPGQEARHRSMRWAAGSSIELSLSPEGGLGTLANIRLGRPRATRFVGVASIPGQLAAQVWGQVAAKPEEDIVLAALRIVEPGVTRIATAISPTASLFVRLDNEKDRVPLGSLGDGVGRLLVLSCQLVAAAGGVLLIDDIDAGLHVSTMEPMWKLILETARKLDVQVFATTHSDDCLRGLASVLDVHPLYKDEVSLHRVQRDALQTICYSGEEILQSALSNTEVR